MNYEIDFIGNVDAKKDADAIAFRFFDVSLNRYRVYVFDGGTSEHGVRLSYLLDNYYFARNNKPIIDAVFCSHSDLDHASGLSRILYNYPVKALYMNRPWLYVEEIFPLVNDGRITKSSFVDRLKDSYYYISNLESIAIEKNIPIFESFSGTFIDRYLTILSPSKEFYLKLLVESSKTPLSSEDDFYSRIKEILGVISSSIKESWSTETLRESVTTTPENEMSIILLGVMGEKSFLLTGDSGTRGLREAINYTQTEFNISLRDIDFYQIPHHGSRRNVSPSILNDLLGNVVQQGIALNKSAFVSVAKGSDHPRKMVVNAFLRIGVNVYKTNGSDIWQHEGTEDRSQYSHLNPLSFSDDVEEWT